MGLVSGTPHFISSAVHKIVRVVCINESRMELVDFAYSVQMKKKIRRCAAASVGEVMTEL